MNKFIYTLDIETDPFKYGRKPLPFAIGCYDGVTFHSEWGSKCVDKMRSYVEKMPEGIFYIHNGGKFDLYYMMDWLSTEHDLCIINGRIVRAYMKCDAGFHQIRDSYAIMPFPLSKYKKDDIDYALLEKEVRNKHKAEILKYLKGDCVYLHELCVDFVEKFGDHLTIGGTSMAEFSKLYKFERLNEDVDTKIRKRYYYGGRVQCFEKGVIKGDFNIYDINQSYPNAMRNFQHPISAPSYVGKKITKDTFFIGVRGINKGAFPVRTKTGIDFTGTRGDYYVTIHEYIAAIELELFVTERILETVDFNSHSSFELFVDKFHALREDAQNIQDDTGSLFYKYVSNSCYGKFAQSPDNYFNYRITRSDVNLNSQGYERESLMEFTDYVLWRIPSETATRYNVATGASITGAARAVLMRGIANADGVLYCDTDSIVCKQLNGVVISDTKLGAWKIENSGNKFAVAGKKMYALFDGDECVKMASKGVRLTAEQIIDLANGKEITYMKDVPTFRFDGSEPMYLTRRIRMT